MGPTFAVISCIDYVMASQVNDEKARDRTCADVSCIDYVMGSQVEGCKLRDYEGNYAEFLEKNEDEAEIMASKEAKAKKIQQDNTKSKSKMSKVCSALLQLLCTAISLAGLLTSLAGILKISIVPPTPTHPPFHIHTYTLLMH